QGVLWGETSLNTGGTPPRLQLMNAGFTYGSDGFSLKNIHADIHPYDQVAIVGKSGAGKTTLLHIVAGLVPLSSGEIQLNGRARAEISYNDWFIELSYMSQDPYLSSGTIAENIASGATHDANRAESEQAAEKAGRSKS